MHGFSVDHFILQSSADSWEAESARVASASSLISGLSSAGFRPDAQSSVTTFLATWGGHVSSMSTRAGELSANLSTTAQDYRSSDDLAWLELQP